MKTLIERIVDEESAPKIKIPNNEAAKRKKKKVTVKKNHGYFKGTRKSNKQMADEINKCAKEPRPKSCYKDWTADKTYRKSKGGKAKMKEEENIESVLDESLDDLLSEILEEGKKLSKKTRETLKKKAEKANMPLGALTAVYRKGLGAWLSGHRQGVPQHAWAMGRVNSFIRGGKTRSVDKAQWKQVQKHRKK